MMNVKGSEPHGRLKVPAAVKHSFSPIGQGDYRLLIGLQIKIQKFSWRLVAEESTSSYYHLPVLVVQEIQQ